MSSSDASASPPASLQADCSALRDASLCDGGDTDGGDTETLGAESSLEVLREQLRRMHLRLAESERTGDSLAHELGATQEHFSSSLAHLQNEHACAMQALESNLRAEVRGDRSATADPSTAFAFSGLAGPTLALASAPLRGAGCATPSRAGAARELRIPPHHVSPRSRGPRGATDGFPPKSQAQDALDAAATELEAAASERAHLWCLLRDSGKEESTPPQRAVPRRASVGNLTSARAAAWATP
jgi:hypothetical protein